MNIRVNDRNNYWESRFKKHGQIYGTNECSVIHKIICYLDKKDKILEISGGYGRNSVWLAKKGFKNIICTDGSQEAILLAKKIYSKIPGLIFEKKDALKLDYLPNTFSLVFSIYGLNVFTFREATKIFKKVYSILKPNGIFCNTFLTIDDDEYGKGKLIDDNTYLFDDGQFVKFYTFSEIQSIHDKFSFDIILIEKTDEKRKIINELITSRFFFVIAKKCN